MERERKRKRKGEGERGRDSVVRLFKVSSWILRPHITAICLIGYGGIVHWVFLI